MFENISQRVKIVPHFHLDPNSQNQNMRLCCSIILILIDGTILKGHKNTGGRKSSGENTLLQTSE